MRGSAAAQSRYQFDSSVGEKPLAVLELNANTGIGYQYAGYYFNTFPNTKPPGTENDPTSPGTALPTTFLTYTDGAVQKVRGAAFTTGTKKINQYLIDGSAETNIPFLTYVDEPDAKYEETFSIINCLKPNRPNPGIVRMASNKTNLAVPSARGRLYPASRTHAFKYWRAENLNSSVPFVYYSRDFLANKIKIVVQNYIGVPKNYRVQVLVLVNGSLTWTDVWTQADGAFPTNGIFKIYRYDGAWTTTPNTEKIHDISSVSVSNTVKIRGIRLVVTAMNSFFNGYVAPNSVTKKPTANTVPLDIYPSVVQNNNVPLELIEISARLSLDITESVKNFDSVTSLSEEDSALPVGSLIANDMKLELENYDAILSFKNTSSPLYGWEMKRSSLDVYFLTSLSNTSVEVNRIFTGTITEKDEAGADLEIVAMDNSSVLQTQRISSFVSINRTITSLIIMLMDYAGISGFVAHFSDSTVPITSDFSHAENRMVRYYDVRDQTVFEALSDLAEAYQFALTFDADNVLHMYSKEAMLDHTDAPVMTLTYEDSGGTLANIKSIEVTPGKPINDITIEYNQKFISKTPAPWSLGEPMWEAQLVEKESPAWEADAEWLAAAPLVKTLSASEGTTANGVVVLDQEGGDGLRFQGYLLIDQEVIAYDAKEYQMKVGGSYSVKYLESKEQYDYWRNKVTSGTRMFFTGRCRIPAGGRGKFDSDISAHSVEEVGSWPYKSSFNSYKFQSLLSANHYLAATGEETWNYRGGNVWNLRGTSADPRWPTRNGSESCIRMSNATEVEFASGATALNPVSACRTAGHAYLTRTPVKSGTDRYIPRRIGAGVRIVGRVDGNRKSISALGVTGAGGVAQFMRWSSTTHQMWGWVLEIRPNVEIQTDNVILYEIVASEWVRRASGTAIVNVWPPDQNTSVDTTDIAWNHLDLAYFPKNNATDGEFIGYVDGTEVLSYTPETQITTSAWYGTIVRGDSYMDVDYTWWSDRADPDGVAGFGNSSNADPSKYTLEDSINGAGGPPAWWRNGPAGFDADHNTTGGVFGINEFGPIAHAVSVRDVDFDDGPYLNPRVANTANAEFIVPVSDLGPYGGKLVIVNARRRAVNIAGDSAPLSIVGYKIEDVPQRYSLDEHIRSGNYANSQAGSTIEAKVAASRTVHGYIPLSIQSDLIQDADTARDLLSWLSDKCTIDCDTLSVDIFGNPLVEPGDKVSIIHPDYGYTATNKFVVMRVTSGWENGLTTSLVLRRIK